jgi:ribosomal protein S27E
MKPKRISSNKQYAKCVDCKTRRIVYLREWDRVSQPRCHACGGRLEPLGEETKSGAVTAIMRTAKVERKNLREA